MSDLILHHYPQSPFAEKMRLILGYKKLSWQSVLAPMIMPKLNLTALTGGYRRINIRMELFLSKQLLTIHL